MGIGRSFDVVSNREELKRRVMILSRYLSFIVKKKNHNPLSYQIQIKYEYNFCQKAQENTNKIFNEFDFKNSMIKLFKEADKHKNYGVIQLLYHSF